MTQSTTVTSKFKLQNLKLNFEVSSIMVCTASVYPTTLQYDATYMKEPTTCNITRLSNPTIMYVQATAVPVGTNEVTDTV